MNKTNLIDLSGNNEMFLQFSSPQKQDPFDLVLECALKNDCENKENIYVENTPTPRKNKKILKEPLYLENECAEPSSLKRKDLKHLLGVCKKSPNLDLSVLSSASNVSLQCLNDSAFANDDFQLNESLEVAIKIPLPASPETEFREKLQLLDQEKNSLLKSIQENVGSGGNSLFNNAFVSDTSKVNHSSLSSLTSKDSYKNFSLFNSTGARVPDVSNIRSSASSSTSTKGYEVPSLLNVAFTRNSGQSGLILQRGCSSARRPTKSERALSYLASVSDTPKRNFNNSFSGFDVQERRNDFKLDRSPLAMADKNDSVFIEAKQMAHMFSRMDQLEDDSSDDCDLSDCTPPWIDPNNESDAQKSKSPKQQKVCESTESVQANETEPSSDNVTSTTDNVMKNAPTNSEENEVVLRASQGNKKHKAVDRKSLGEDLLNTLTLALRLSDSDDGNSEKMDRKKLGRSLLNTLTLAFNMDSSDTQVTGEAAAGPGLLDPRMQKSSDTEEALDLSVSSSIFKTPNKERSSSPEATRKPLPRIQISGAQLPTAVHTETRLKPKCDKDKAVCRGPLKAVIPLRNMTKSQKSAGLRAAHAAVPELADGAADFRNKRTSTPNVLKTKGPIAQSTPDMRKLPTDAESKSLCKSKLRYSLSPLAKRTGANESSDMNKSLPSRNVSGTTPAKRVSTSTSKDSLNTSIPSISSSKSILRRKSASDLKEGGAQPVEPARALKRASELKRSSSFQSKISSAFRSIRTKTSLGGPAN